MRTNENSKFTLHKTATQDWYNADEVDKFIKSMIDDLAEIDRLLDILRGQANAL